MRWSTGLALLGALLVMPLAAWAVDSPTTGGPDVSSARARIKAKDYAGALVELKRLEYTGHPDVYSLMGYSYRKSGDRPHAFAYYKKALDGDPNHRGALEYQGELYVEVGQVANAQQNAARLRGLCPEGCEELEDLQEAIEKAPAKP